MAVSIVMPALELAQETGKLLSWRKKEGDHVVKGEPLVEIETDKAVVEIEAPGDGILAAVKAREGAVVPVGQTIAWLVQPGEAPPVETAPTQTGRTQSATRPSTRSARPEPAEGRNPQSATRNPQSAISPKARRLAREHGIDLSRVTGSGPAGEILAEDIRSAIGNQPAIRNPQSAMSLSSVVRLMAERTTRSWTTVPHFFLTREVDATALVAARETIPDSTITDLLVAIVARVLKKHPRMNASWTDRGAGASGSSAAGIRSNADVNVAVTIAVTDAVVTGVIHHADTASLADIGARRKALTERARAGRLQPADVTGATFTISNLGMYHVDAFTAVIVPPQAGILAVGAITDRAVAIDGKPAVRPMMTLTLSCDHRVIDGARGAAFLNDLVDALRAPDWRHAPPTTAN